MEIEERQEMIGLKESTLKMIINKISSFQEIEHAIIFGSIANGSYKKGSDIDIAVKGSDITNDVITRLSRKLNQELPIPHKIDVVHYDCITNKELVDHINVDHINLEGLALPLR